MLVTTVGVLHSYVMVKLSVHTVAFSLLQVAFKGAVQ